MKKIHKYLAVAVLLSLATITAGPVASASETPSSNRAKYLECVYGYNLSAAICAATYPEVVETVTPVTPPTVSTPNAKYLECVYGYNLSQAICSATYLTKPTAAEVAKVEAAKKAAAQVEARKATIAKLKAAQELRKAALAAKKVAAKK